MAELFTCANCGRSYPKEWSDAEAEAEYRAAFPQASHEGRARAVVCDDCYTAFLAWARERGLLA